MLDYRGIRMSQCSCAAPIIARLHLLARPVQIVPRVQAAPVQEPRPRVHHFVVSFVLQDFRDDVVCRQLSIFACLRQAKQLHLRLFVRIDLVQEANPVPDRPRPALPRLGRLHPHASDLVARGGDGVRGCGLPWSAGKF